MSPFAMVLVTRSETSALNWWTLLTAQAGAKHAVVSEVSFPPNLSSCNLPTFDGSYCFDSIALSSGGSPPSLIFALGRLFLGHVRVAAFSPQKPRFSPGPSLRCPAILDGWFSADPRELAS